MEEKKKSKKIIVFKYISLGIALITNAFILYQSSIEITKSQAWETWATNIWTNLLNERFQLKEDVEIVNPESISFGPNNFAFNSIDGYEDDEIPIGCAKQLSASLSPINTTNKSVTFSAYPSENVNLVQSDNVVTVEALKLGEVTIKAKSNIDDTLVSEFKYTVVDKVAPVSFLSANEHVTIKNGKSALINLQSLDNKFSNELMLARYYDFNKLSISSSDESVVSIRKPYLKALNVGSATVTVSNGTITKNIDVIVENSSSPIISASSLNISGNNEVHVMDIDDNKFNQLNVSWGGEVPTDTNVIWSVDNAAAAIVTQSGEIYGYRKIDPQNDVGFTVRATSVDNPSIYQDFDMKLCHVIPNSISLSSTLPLDFNGNYILNTGKTSKISVNYGDTRVSKTGFEISVSDSSIVSAYAGGNNVTIVGLKEGNTTLVVSYKYDNNIKTDNFNITVVTRDYINEDNKDSFSFTVRKYFSGHAFLFMVAAIFTTLYLFLAHVDRPLKIKAPATASTVLLGFGFACLSEYIQTFVPGRNGVWKDVGIDLIGYAIGFVLVAIGIGIYLLVKMFKNRKKN